MNILYVPHLPGASVSMLRSEVIGYFTGAKPTISPGDEMRLSTIDEQLASYGVAIGHEYVISRNVSLSGNEQANGMDTVPFLMMLEDIRFVVVGAHTAQEFVELVGAFSAYPNVFKNACLAHLKPGGGLVVASPIGGASTLLLQSIRLKTNLLVVRPEFPKAKALDGKPFTEIVFRTVAGGEREEFINTSEEFFLKIARSGTLVRMQLPGLARSLKTVRSNPSDPLLNVRNALRIIMSYGFSGSLGDNVIMSADECASANPLNAWINLRRLRDGHELIMPEEAEKLVSIYAS
jgi:hypothetical protein